MSNLIIRAKLEFTFSNRTISVNSRFHFKNGERIIDLMLLKVFGDEVISNGETRIVELVVVNPLFSDVKLEKGQEIRILQGTDVVGKGHIISLSLN